MLIFLSAIVEIRVISCAEDDLCIISDFKNLFYSKLKKMYAVKKQRVFYTHQIQFVYFPKERVMFRSSLFLVRFIITCVLYVTHP